MALMARLEHSFEVLLEAIVMLLTSSLAIVVLMAVIFIAMGVCMTLAFTFGLLG